mgnify:CR=1 FL=1
MMTRYSRFSVCFVSFVVCLVLFCTSFLPASAAEHPIRFRQLTVEDGLPTNLVRWMIQDHLGFLWLSTPNGLARYDGYTFVTYSPESDDPGSLSLEEYSAIIGYMLRENGYPEGTVELAADGSALQGIQIVAAAP